MLLKALDECHLHSLLFENFAYKLAVLTAVVCHAKCKKLTITMQKIRQRKHNSGGFKLYSNSFIKPFNESKSMFKPGNTLKSSTYSEPFFYICTSYTKQPHLNRFCSGDHAFIRALGIVRVVEGVVHIGNISEVVTYPSFAGISDGSALLSQVAFWAAVTWISALPA